MNTHYTIPLPWIAPPLTLNQRMHFRPKAKLTAAVRAEGKAAAIRANVPALARPSVQLVWLVTTRHRRDSDNLVATLKALCDGLVDAGVAADDTPEFMHKGMPIIAYAKDHPGAPGLFLTLWESGGMTLDEQRALNELGAL